VYDRQVGEAIIDFKWNNNGTTDSVTSTTWDLEKGIGIKGDMMNKTLRSVNSLTVYWFVWADYFHDTEVFEN
jgi:hypothetical protein